MEKVLFLPFEASRFFTYKYEKEIILEYPLKSVMSKDDLENFMSENPCPTVGFLFLRLDKNSKKSPFAEIIIEKIYKPKDIKTIWEAIIKIHLEESKSISQSFEDVKKTKEFNPDIVDIVDKFISQKSLNDDIIKQSIKIKDDKLSSEAKLLWFSCSIIENFSCSGFKKDGEYKNFHEYLQEFSPYQQSVAYLMNNRNYFEFRKAMKLDGEYSVGIEARDKSFSNLQKEFVYSEYVTIFKLLSEQAWRDLLCTIQLNYRNNLNKSYKVLMHLILEKYLGEEFKLVDFDTEVKWKLPISTQNKTGRLDAFINLIDKNDIQTKCYFEFKRFNNSLTEQKDINYQPYAIKENHFDSNRYKHTGNDKWYYIAVTNGTNYTELEKDIINKENYKDFSWKEVFKVIAEELYPQAVNSADKSLINFLDFLVKK